MKPLKTFCLALALGAIGFSGAASAHGHFYGPRVHLGFAFGGPAWGWGPGYYYPPAYYYPPVVAAPSPPQYIERSDAAEAQDYWYYCAGSKAYYPYVKECAGGWQRVTPRPQG